MNFLQKIKNWFDSISIVRPRIENIEKEQKIISKNRKDVRMSGKTKHSHQEVIISRKGLTHFSDTVFEKSKEFFESEEMFIEWLHTKNYMLNKKPIDCSEEDILDVLGKYSHGNFC